jgi:hypothetical protein
VVIGRNRIFTSLPADSGDKVLGIFGTEIRHLGSDLQKTSQKTPLLPLTFANRKCPTIRMAVEFAKMVSFATISGLSCSENLKSSRLFKI